MHSPQNTEGIVVSGLCKTYKKGRVKALDGLNLHIKRGEAFGIIGPNGAGKTTFLGCLLSLLNSDAGQISIDGYAVDDLYVRNRTGYMPERLDFEQWMSGREFLTYHHELANQPSDTRKKDVEEAFDRLGLSQECRSRSISKYSRGMLQRLGLAQAIIGKPQYLFLDEPASGIDPGGILLVRELLLEQRKRGATLVLNSHQLEQVERICDRVAFISSGKIQTIEDLHNSGNLPRRLRINWSVACEFEEHRLKSILESTDHSLVSIGQHQAVYQVENDSAATQLIRHLLEAELPVVEAQKQFGSLEHLFIGNKPDAVE
jgi:ABC-2 type transport system ATP-binding protein